MADQTNAFPSQDEIYVNDGNSYENGIYYPEVPEERLEAEQEEASAVAGTEPVINALKQWFREQIAETNNLDNIQTEILEYNGVKRERTVSIEAQILAYQILHDKFQAKSHEFDAFLKEQV